MHKNMIAPTDVRYIKLGSGGSWEHDCIESSKPTIRLGFVNPYHEDCVKGKWDRVHRHWSKYTTKNKATENTNQIKDFYTLDESTLWVTFYKRRLYWCFARKEIAVLPSGDRVRRVKGQWKSKSVTGEDLLIDRLSGQLTKMQGFRGTICGVGEWEYLIRRINAQKMPEVEAAEESVKNLLQALIPLVQRLGWKDFELLCDIIFTNGGWRRNSRVGGTEKDVDLDLSAPVSGKRAFVQIKSQADEGTLKDYIKTFIANGLYDEMYFAVHSPFGDYKSWNLPERVTILGPEEIVRLAMSAGLTDWIIQKNA